MKKIILCVLLFALCFCACCEARSRKKEKSAKPEVKKVEPVKIPIPAKVEKKEVSSLSKEQINVLAGVADQIIAIQSSKKAFESAVAELKELETKQQSEIEKSAVMRDGKKQIDQIIKEEIEVKYCEKIAKLKVIIVEQRKKYMEAQKNFKLVD